MSDAPGRCRRQWPLPSRMLIGWGAEDYSGHVGAAKWNAVRHPVDVPMRQSGNNWYNDFGFGLGGWLPRPTILLSTVHGMGFIPGIHYYYMGYGHCGGDPGLLSQLQQVSWSTSRTPSSRVWMQQIKSYGQPVVLVLEGDELLALASLS